MLNPDKTAANVAIVQNCYGLFFRGDLPGLLEQATPDVMWETVGNPADFPLFGRWPGRDGMSAFFTKLIETLDFTEFTPKEFFASGETVFVNGHYAWTLKANGRSQAMDWVHVFTLKDGLVTSFREHTDTAKFAAAWRDAEGEAANAAMVATVYADFAKGDIQAVLAHCSPNVVWISGGSHDDFPTLGERHGIEGAMSFFADVAAHDQFTSFEPRSIRASGNRVFAEGHYGITATASGRHFESDWVHAFTMVDGNCVRFQEFTDTAAFYKSIR
jgi:ketosteroid isomerase-like protein